MTRAAGLVRPSVGTAAVYLAGQPGKRRQCDVGPGGAARGQATPGGRHTDKGRIRAACERYGWDCATTEHSEARKG